MLFMALCCNGIQQLVELFNIAGRDKLYPERLEVGNVPKIGSIMLAHLKNRGSLSLPGCR